MNRLMSIAFVLLAVPLTSQTPNSNCFVDPFDGKQYPNLQSYVPTGTIKSGENDTVVYLLTNQDQIGERVKIDALASYIKLAKEKIIEATKNNKNDFLLLARYDLNPKSHKIKIYSSKTVDKSLLEAILDSLDSLKPPVVSDQVLFCVQYSVGS